MKSTQKSYWLCYVFSILLCTYSQAQTIDGFVCHVEFDSSGSTQLSSGALASLGRELTPRGDQRFLLVFAGFEGFEGVKDTITGEIDPPLLSGWENINNNPDFQLPSYLTFENGVVKTSPMFFNDYDDFDPQGSIMEDSLNRLSVSNILNMMSKPNEDFKFIGEVFTNPQGEPVLVTIDFATGSENITPLTFHTQNSPSHSKLLSSLLTLIQ